MVFRADQEIGRDLAAVDWASTPLGPVDSWPQSLRTTVNILLASRFPMWMAWGPELTFFCNDAYRRDTLGLKYPWALGRPGSRGLVRDLAGHRPPDRTRAVDRGGDLGRGPAAVPRAVSGYTRGDLPHVLLQPAARRRRRLWSACSAWSARTPSASSAQRRMATLRDLGADPSVAAHRGADAGLRRAASSRGTRTTFRSRSPTCSTRTATPGLPGRPGSRPGTRRRRRPSRATVPRSGRSPERCRASPSWSSSTVDHRICRPAPGASRPFRRSLVPILQQAGATSGPLRRRAEPATADSTTATAGSSTWWPARSLRGSPAHAAIEAEQQRAEALAELDQAKTTFFSNVSHEFRTPLTLILGPVEELLGRPTDTDERARRELELMQRNGLRLVKLVNTLLDFSRIRGRTHARPLRAGRPAGTPPSWPASSGPRSTGPG